jgi:hypothetical protein
VNVSGANFPEVGAGAEYTCPGANYVTPAVDVRRSKICKHFVK